MVLSSTRPVRQLLLALVLVTQVPAVVTMGALLNVESLRQREAVSDDMVERSRVIAVALRDRLETSQLLLEKLASEVPDGASGMAAFHERASKVQAAAGFDAIILARSDGEQVINTRLAFGTPLPRVNAASLKPFASGGKTITDLAIGSVSRTPGIAVGVPVLRNARIAYALDGVMDARRFRDMLLQQNLPAGWIAAIVDANGIIIGRIPGHEAHVGRGVGQEVYDLVAARGTTSDFAVLDSTTLDGVPAVTAVRRSPVNGWMIVVSVPSAALHAPVWRSALLLAVGFAVILASSVSAALFISGHIGTCIRRLRDAAATLPRGQKIDTGPMCFAEAHQLGQTLEQARAEIAAAHAEVRSMAEHFHRTLLENLEARLAQIARELHDSVGSSLAGVSMLLGNAAKNAADPRQGLLLEKAHEQVRLTNEQVRAISRGMMPAGSEAGGLLAAVEQFASDLTLYQRVHCVVNSRGEVMHIPPGTATHLYRIVQEATSNATRHGRANRIRIALLEVRGRYRLTITDNGQGTDLMALPTSHPGMGLRSMQARARAIGAKLEVRSHPSHGCRVRISWTAEAPAPREPERPARRKIAPKVEA